MDFSRNRDLPQMKYFVGQKVNFKFNNEGEILHGNVEIADFGGSIEHDYHSYDIYVKEDNTLYKHVPEAHILSESVS